MTYQEAKAEADRLTAATKAASEKLKLFPKGPTGLTPDAVKAQPEWKAAKRAYAMAFNRERNFNAWFVPKFKEEIRNDR